MQHDTIAHRVEFGDAAVVPLTVVEEHLHQVADLKPPPTPQPQPQPQATTPPPVERAEVSKPSHRHPRSRHHG
jgi:hypothetical protein